MALVPTASSTITVYVPVLVAVTAISAASAPESAATSTKPGFWSRMRGVNVLVWLISPTRMTRRSPVVAEKAQASASPIGEMVPV